MKVITVLVSVFLTGCGTSFYMADTSLPKAGLRVATNLGGNTFFSLGSRDSCEKKDFHESALGWFHPSAGSVQAWRRGTDKRVGLKGGDIFESNMQAEHYINVGLQPRIRIENISGFTYGAFSNLESCNGFFDIDMQPNKNYEIYTFKSNKKCNVVAHELIDAGENVDRIKVSVSRACI